MSQVEGLSTKLYVFRGAELESEVCCLVAVPAQVEKHKKIDL